jgi:hypothetical protein
MKKLITLTILAFSLWSHAQNGITYQAVILNPNTEELPGADNSRLPLVNQNICLDFKIVNATAKLEYQETITTQTDEYGMVNVIIGTGTRKAGIATQFSAINWDGAAKSLIVSLDPTDNCSDFIEISDQPFTYVPFALYAANGGATGPQGPAGPAGTIGLDGKTVLNGTSNPSTSLGTNGDFYINTITNSLFGPKTNDLWGNGVPLVGPQGIQGIQGIAGPTGSPGPQGIAGINGNNGQDGLSTYQIWLNAGNTGTEAQFLTALRGENGAQGPQGIQGVAGPAGATGQQGTAGINGTNGTNGNDGLSAYQIWLNAGNTGTEAQFVTALRGATGAQGIQGIQGPTGPQGTAGTNGTNGTNGLSAYQIWLNAGNTGTEAQFLTALRGETGAQGIQGPTGLTGATGHQGIAGTNGTNGINGTNGNDGLSAYQIWLNAGNTGTEAQFLTALRGATGAQGPQGQNGATWLNDTTTPNTTLGNTDDFYLNTTTGEYYKKSSNNSWVLQGNLTGPQGTVGTTNINGSNNNIYWFKKSSNSSTYIENSRIWYDFLYTTGYNSNNDITHNTTTGEITFHNTGIYKIEYYIMGSDNRTINNVQLLYYSNGLWNVITDGVGGNQTFNSNSIVLSITSGEKIKIRMIGFDIYSSVVISQTGTTGPQGSNGLSAYQIWLNAGNTGTEAQFLTALRGATGAQGPQGTSGTNGNDGLSAYQIWLNAGNTGTEAQFVTALRGATGAQGPQGIQGPVGLTGATGPQGPAGTNGTNGSNGLSAYQIWLNAGNTGTEAQFLTALRGANGGQGPQGIQGIQGTTGTNGKNSLINTTTEAAGNNCVNGGVKIEVGLDLNNNGTLETSEINNNNTKYICNVNSSNLTLQERLDLGENPFTLINSGIPINNFYGKNYQGGLIFYLDSTTSSGLVVTNYNVKGQGNYGCYNVNIATGSGIFDGLQNTINTVYNGCANYNHPATVCYNLIYNGYDDWYLPSSGEAMKIVNNIPGWNQYEFWTSTQTSPTQQVLIQGNGEGNGDKNTFNYPFTRAIRTFH